MYNNIGELIENKQEGLGYEYNAAGLVTRVYQLSTGNSISEYTYNDKGLKYSKTSYSGGLANVETEQLFYVYDAGGAEVATYKKLVQVPNDVYALQRHTLYGAGRVGLLDKITGKALYELSDHLGNVRAVVTASANGAAETVSYTDYYPHGGVLPGRTYQSSLNFPYGYQGQEKDAATGLTNFELRQYDPRIGRWYNPDPYMQHHSPYLAMSNNPVSFTDPDGGFDTDDPGNPDKDPVYSYGHNGVDNGIWDRYNTGWGNYGGDDWINKMEYQANRGADIHRRNELRGKYSGIGMWSKEVSMNGVSEGKTFDGFYGKLSNGTKETISASDAILYASQVSSTGTQPNPGGRPYSMPIPGSGNSPNPTPKPPFRFIPPVGGIGMYAAALSGLMQADSRIKTEGHSLARREEPPTHKLYTLRALEDGLYDVYEWGKQRPVGKVPLKKGDIWKIGETEIGKQRYRRSELDAWGVEMKDESVGSKPVIKGKERQQIFYYMMLNNGKLPPGNKMIR